MKEHRDDEMSWYQKERRLSWQYGGDNKLIKRKEINVTVRWKQKLTTHSEYTVNQNTNIWWFQFQRTCCVELIWFFSHI
jgi:hypothetical protein